MHVAATMAAMLLLAGGSVAQFLGVSPPRIPGVFEGLGCPSISHLPLRNTPVSVSSDSTVTISVEAWCNGLPISGLASGSCAAAQNWKVLDDGNFVSDLEAEMTVEVEPGTSLTIILIDLSNSIAALEGYVQSTKDAAKQLILSLFEGQEQGNSGLPTIAVHSFDGRAATQIVSDWSQDKNALLAAVDRVVCGGASGSPGVAFCGDSSTELYGSLIQAADMVRARRTLSTVVAASTARGYDNAVVVFTDGRDLAGRFGATDARSALTREGLLVFALGAATPQRTTQVADLIAITGDEQAAFLGANAAALPGLAKTVAGLLVPYYSRSYRITYCSPRRAGTHTVDVMIVKDGTTGPSMGFISGERVAYVPDRATGLVTMGTITAVTLDNTNNLRQILYTLTLEDGSNRVVSVLGSELEHVYTTDTFTTAPKCALRNLISSTRTQPCTSASGGALAPYTCTGGSAFSCTTQQCACPSNPAQCSATTCSANDQTTVPPLVVQKNCADGLPTAPINFQASNFKILGDSTLSLVFTPQCRDGSPVGGLTFSPCASLSSLKLYETDAGGDYKPVSLYESRPRITCVPQPAHVTTIMLLDMSDSILRGYGSLQRMKDYANAYLDGLGVGLNSHVVSVYTFDGQRDIIRLADFGGVAAAKTAIASLTCDGNRCLDHSTNLNGAVVQGAQLLTTYHAANPVNTNDNVARQPFIALFTDGADQAQYNTDAEARIASSNGISTFAIGLQGEVRSQGLWMRGVDSARLQQIAPAGLFILPTATGLQTEFAKVGQAISSAAAKSYRLDYCSPKRTGVHSFKLELTQGDGQQTYWEQSFNAQESITCGVSGQDCNQCLGGLVSEFACGNQPTQDNQNFACAAGATPVERNGYCRCPCGNEAEYPGPNVVGPGPIICEPQGTCARGDRVTCSKHGGLPVQDANRPAGYSQFGVNRNSRVSMRFTPQCADEWPMPKLRMSVCDSLSDFQILETNSDGVLESVSKFESEPRVVCYPDVVSAILLDTSGSVRLGDGEEAIRAAVRTYLNEMSKKLIVKHYVAIFAFDGKQDIQQISAFTSDQNQLLAAINGWSCGGTFCTDFSTNLYGAIQQIVLNVLNPQVENLAWTQQPHLIIFSDGTDQASRATEAQALATLAGVTYPLETYAVGLVGEMNNGKMGLDRASLDRLAPGGVFVAENNGALVSQFEQVALAIIARTAETETATYRIDYCSPKRSGLTNVTVVLQHEGAEYRWSQVFDAGAFDCENENCKNCLSSEKYSCSNQPLPGTNGGDQQFFSCDANELGNSDPVTHNGQCKCPCVGTYPPDATPTPLIVSQSPNAVSPIISPNSGPYPSTVQVTISYTATVGAEIKYTLDGSTPDGTSPTYTGPFTINTIGTTTVRAAAMSGGLVVSSVGSSSYTITDGTTPTGPYCSPFDASGFTLIPGLNQRYTRDDSKQLWQQPTFWSADLAYFFYFCTSTAQTTIDGGGQWRVTTAAKYALMISLSDSPSCNSVARGPAGIVMSGGTWQERAETSPVFSSVNVVLNCVGGTPNGNSPTAVIRNSVVVSRGSHALTDVFTSITSGITDTTVTGTCSTVPSTSYVGVPTLTIAGSTSILRFTVNAVGTSTMSCVLRNSAGATSVYNLAVSVSDGTTPGVTGQEIWLTLRQLLSTFNVADLVAKIQAILTAAGLTMSPVLNWVCPETFCFNGGTCPTTGCLNSNGQTMDRSAVALQSASNSIADLSFLTNNQPSTTADTQNALNAINADISRCQLNTGNVCQLSTYNPASQATFYSPSVTPPFTFTPNPDFDDDDSDTNLEDWEIALIVAACILCCSIVAAIIFVMMKKKKEPKQQPYGEYDSPARQKELSTYNDQPQSRGASQSYDESYYSQSYYEYDTFNVDEKVRALYVDGSWYDATIWAVGTDGTYEVKWAEDGTHSEGIPPDQIKRP